MNKINKNWLLTCADVHWICTYRCWDGGQLWGVGCFQLGEGSERAPDEAESPLSVPPPPPVDHQDGSDHSWPLGCPAVPSQSGEGEVKRLEENYRKQMLLEGTYYFHSRVHGCYFELKAGNWFGWTKTNLRIYFTRVFCQNFRSFSKGLRQKKPLFSLFISPSITLFLYPLTTQLVDLPH